MEVKTMDEKLRIGFIGLGLMGNPMAKNIFKKGFPLAVYNRNLSKLSEFKKLGVQIFDTPKELAKNVDVVISMVTGPKDVREVLLGKNGAAEGASKKTIFIDMSTIGPKAAQEIAEDLNTFGMKFLDSPVTGSVTRATEGTLTIFIGGEKKVFEKVRGVFEAMGENLQYMGSVGSGQAIKLVNNLIIGESLAAWSEGMLLADTMGLKREKVAEALGNAMVMSPAIKMKIPNMVGNKFPVAFSMANMEKDLKLAMGESSGKLPVLKLVEKFYRSGVKNGLSNEDNSAILKVITDNIKKQ